MFIEACSVGGRRRGTKWTLAARAVEGPEPWPVFFSVLRLHACAVVAFVRARFRTAQVGWHFAIVDPLLVARLAAEPLLGGAGWLGLARFAVGTRHRNGRCQRHQQEERPRHDVDRRTQHHPRRIGHRRGFRFYRIGTSRLERLAYSLRGASAANSFYCCSVVAIRSADT